MKITCPGCQTKYHVSNDKVPARGAWAQCPNCGQKIPIPGGDRSSGSGDPSKSSSGPDYGRTMAYDFSEVDQGRTEATALLEQISGQEPFIRDDLMAALRDISTGQEYALTMVSVTLGRTGADIRLSDPEVSRRHCLIKVFGDRFVVTDLGSTNGTYFRGKKVVTANLGPGERFTVGNTTLEPVLRRSD